MSKKSSIALLPARGGSKRIPNKNIKDFLGKPMIHYPLETAKKSNLFDRIIVSTDSKNIKKISELGGAEVPFLRPSNISEDNSILDDVIKNFLLWLDKQDYNYDYLCCILPTTPLLKASYLVEGIKCLKKNNSTTTMAVTEYAYPIMRSFRINSTGKLEMLWPENYQKRSQDFDGVYHDAGQFYWINIEK